MSNNETYYCENCFKEGLTQDETIADSIGGIFCSKKCRTEFKKFMKTGIKIDDYLKEETK